LTDLKLQTNPPAGSGFTHGFLDELYGKRQSHQHIEYIAVQGLLKISGHSESDTANGTKRVVKGEFVRLEPVRENGQAEDVAWQITRSYEARTTPNPNGQTELPLSNSPEEKRRSLRDQLAEWASDHGVSEEELDERFVDMLGGTEHAAAMHVRDASLVHLIEFVGYTCQEEQTSVPMPTFTDSAAEADAEDPDDDA
jgi:hypothetical protein